MTSRNSPPTDSVGTSTCACYHNLSNKDTTYEKTNDNDKNLQFHFFKKVTILYQIVITFLIKIFLTLLIKNLILNIPIIPYQTLNFHQVQDPILLQKMYLILLYKSYNPTTHATTQFWPMTSFTSKKYFPYPLHSKTKTFLLQIIHLCTKYLINLSWTFFLVIFQSITFRKPT